MIDHDPLDERLSDAFGQLGDAHSPTITDPESLADQILSRPTVAHTGRSFRGAGRGLRWRFLGALGVVALAGAVTGAWAGSSRTGTTPTPAVTELASAPLWDCPNEGMVGHLTSGDRIVLTGRSEDSRWVELRNPTDLSARAWANATALKADTGIDELAVVECGGRPVATVATVATVAPTSIPEQTSTTLLAEATTTLPPEETIPVATTMAPPPASTTTAPRQSTTTSPSGPSPSPTRKPTPAPDRTGPVLSNVGASPNPIWTQAQPGIPCPPAKSKRTTTVSAWVSDASGVSSVRLDWAVNGHSGTVNMTPTGSTWRGTVGPFADDTLPTSGAGMNQPVSVTVRATDGAGNTSSRTITFELRSSAECFG